MNTITLDKSLLTNVGLIDEQHRELITRINKLHDAMKEGKGREVVQSTLNFLVSYVVKHFTDEESFMEKYECPIKDVNKKAHKDFVEKLKDFESKQARGEVLLSLEIYNDLSKWVINHIKTIDTKMAAYVK
ncbi:MAG: hypothetical protein A2007_06410 [Verrucomicrobia bacterium GWC2_42_7]|nr:MAG: hypothetical protein A2007_06410 [Verrucomicrobia bacterium GWC2_42_7]